MQTCSTVLRTGQVIVGEGAAARSEAADRGGDVGDAKVQRRVRGLRAFGTGKKGDLGGADPLHELALGLGGAGAEAEAVIVEAASPRHVLHGQDAGDLGHSGGAHGNRPSRPGMFAPARHPDCPCGLPFVSVA